MASNTLSPEEKQRVLKALEEDEEFRYAVAGKLGLLEILRRLDRLEEEIAKLREQFNKLYEKSLEHDKRFEAIEKKLLEHDVTLSELARSVRSLTEAVNKLTSQITALGNRYGIYTEEAFRESMKYVIQDLLETCRVERWVYYDSEGVVYGAPSIIEVDVLIHDEEHILVEYKASTDKSDILEIYRIGKLYEKVTGKKPKLLIVSPTIRKRARELAEKLGVEVRGVTVEA